MSDAWLPLEDRLAQWDPRAEQVRVTGWRPGPAGVSSLELCPGLRASVDHASPTTLTEVIVDADAGLIAGDTFDVLTRLVGSHTADIVRQLPTQPSTSRPTPIRYPRRGRSEFDDDVSIHDAQMAHVPFARLLLMADLGDDAGLSDTARAAALLESVLSAMRLQLPMVRDLASRAVSELTNSRPQHLDAEQAARLRRLLDLAQRLGDVPDLDIARARQRIDDADATPAIAAMPMTAAPLQADLAESGVFDAQPPAGTGLPLSVDGDHRSWAWLDHGSNVQFQSSRSAAGAWGRVFRGSDRLLLGLAPLRPGDDGTCRSLVVIPPVSDPEGLVVDVVDDPAAPRRAATHELVRRAIITGRQAARLSRLQDPAADAAWQDCAAQWSALGDAQRANLARRHGRRDDRGRASARIADMASGPLLADEIR